MRADLDMAPGRAHRLLRQLGAALIVVAALGGMAPAGVPPQATTMAGATLTVDVSGLRSTKGDVLLCLTARPDHFPDCTGDPDSRRLTVAAEAAHMLHFANVPPAGYALSLIHDENRNGRLDTRLGIPIEGFGFSRNPRILFGPPAFRSARFDVGTAAAEQRIIVKYLL